MSNEEIASAVVDEIVADVLGRASTAQIRPMTSGSSTPVYRLTHAGTVLYLRFAEHPAHGLAAEVAVHTLLRAKGVRVPEVLHFEPHDERAGRAWMLITEIPGGPVDALATEATVANVYTAAGRDLALVNSIEVRGFGWIARDDADLDTPIQGTDATYAEFVHPEGAVERLTQVGLTPAELDLVEALLADEVTSGPRGGTGRLVHGDIDLPHVFQCDGRYTGLIDFGEIRGADGLYDLAEFALHLDDPERARAYQYLERGYADVTPLPSDYERRLTQLAASIIVERINRWLPRIGTHNVLTKPFPRWNIARLRDILATSTVRPR
ncbi:aminoglycoside phosphotransferase family protein [Nocardia colli]|uniref:Aminoglycoside phosphotransferase family protein n=1 Tax=Nocardia colli TaxID=2545717 RepID=A0A5N0E9V8_9NOCA|nr:aminoglycoside phosphotransferase family protein [Nocardia colli]KAA8886212.1 aminoglycoside phosphotransferase family protein [Nocardia colli]